MKNRIVLILLATLTATILLFTGCGKKADTEPVVSEAVEEIEEVEPVAETKTVEEAESTEEVEPTEPVEEEAVAEDVPLTQEELHTLKSQATTDDQKKALDAYETITKEGSWTSPNGVTYTEVVGKPDGSWRRMTDAEAEKTLETADPVNDINYFLADAELKGKDWVKYDTVTGKVYYDPYEYAPVLEAKVEEGRRISQVDEDLSAEEVKELLGEERYRELFGDYTD